MKFQLDPYKLHPNDHIGRLREEKVEGVRVEDVSVVFAEEGEAE